MSGMLGQSLGIYNVVWYGMAMLALWLLYRIFEILKAIHFMMKRRFEKDFIEPLERRAVD